MTGKIHNFVLKEGGGYQMSLYYPSSDTESPGKTAAKEDRFTSRFIELKPNRKILQAIVFDSKDPAFVGDMLMEVTFEKVNEGTKVTILFTNIPPGIRPEDNEVGTELSLKKLASYVENLTALK